MQQRDRRQLIACLTLQPKSLAQTLLLLADDSIPD